jgi:uncharacterized membrane protein
MSEKLRACNDIADSSSPPSSAHPAARGAICYNPGMETASSQPGWALRVERGARWVLRHWLLCLNTLALVYAGLPWLSPLAKWAGHPILGELLFRIYTPLCHQKAERSFFVCGHQVAFCHRCTAMYTGIVAAGALFALLRRVIPPAPLRLGAALAIPIVIDGGMHLLDDLLGLGLRAGGDAIGTPNFWLRMVTGVLFALALMLTVYPRLERDLKVMA